MLFFAFIFMQTSLSSVYIYARKTFDSVEWPFLFFALSKFGFGPSFISWIRIVYLSPLASVCINNYISDYFPLHRGTRYGCPLRTWSRTFGRRASLWCMMIKGISHGFTIHNLSLYTDNLILYFTDLVVSIPCILELLQTFGQFSGYGLNFGKSVFFPFNQEMLAIQNFHLRNSRIP